MVKTASFIKWVLAQKEILFFFLGFFYAVSIFARQDLPNPTTNMETVPAGSYVIPMDNNYQNIVPVGQAPFNLKAYGLLNELLQEGIRVKWVINSAKTLDGIDFSANAERVAPTAIAAAPMDFRGGPFIVPDTVLPCGLSTAEIIAAFANNVAVYRLMQNTTVDVRYTLSHRPKIAVFNNGGNQLIHTKILDAAGVRDYEVMDAADIVNLINCYTFASEPHADSADVSLAVIDGIRDFVLNGGNFLAQCHAVETYENRGFFHTTTGIIEINTVVTHEYPNADLAYTQIHGPSQDNAGGSIDNWTLAPGSLWHPYTYRSINHTDADTVIAMGAKLTDPNIPGGNVYYLGGHDYSREGGPPSAVVNLTTIERVNALRLYLNAAFVPSRNSNNAWANAGESSVGISCSDSVILGCEPTGPPLSTFNWSPAAGLSCTTCPNPVARPSETTTYVVEVTNGCIARDTIEVVVEARPIADFTNTTVCEKLETEFTDVSTTSNFWSWDFGDPASGAANTSSLENPTHIFSTSGSFQVRLISGTSPECSDTITKTVTVTPSPTVTAGNDVSMCVGSSTQLQASGADSYLWSPSATLDNATIANPMATPLNSDTITDYIVLGTGLNGCESRDTVRVTLLFSGSMEINEDTAICGDQTISLNTNVALSTYSWTPAAVVSDPTIRNPMASPTSTVEIFLDGVDENNCVYRDSLTITVFTKPNLSIPAVSPFCEGDSTQFFPVSDKTVQSYRWYTNTDSLSSTSVENPYANPASSTTYDLEITDTEGCKDSAAVSVTVNPLPTVTAGNDVSICEGSSTQLQAGGADSYLWSPSATLDNATIANPMATPLNSDTITDYIVLGTDLNGCENRDTVRVTLLFPSSMEINEDTAICGDQTIPLNTNIALSTYSWTPAAVVSDPTIRNPMASPTSTVEIFLDGVDENNCPYRDSLTITVFTKPNLSIPAVSPFCEGDSTQFFPVSDKTVQSYRWYTNTDSLSSTSVENPYANPASSTTYDLEITDTEGCLDTATVSVTVNPKPTVTTSDDTKICLGTSTQLLASGASSYVWTPNTNLSPNNTVANPTASPTLSTRYLVTGTNLGCADTSSMLVTVLDNPMPSVTIDYDTDVCMGDSVRLFISSKEHLGSNPVYAWYQQNPDLTSTVISTKSEVKVANFENGTSFYLQVTSNEICVDPANTTVQSLLETPLVYQYPNLAISGPDKVCYGDPAQFFVTDLNGVSLSFTWLNAFNDPLLVSPETSFTLTSVTTEHQIKVASSNWNCADTSVLIRVIPITVFLNLSAEDTLLYLGASTNLIWATNTDSVNFELTPSGEEYLLIAQSSREVSPKETTLYTGVVSNGFCQATDSVSIRVIPPVSAPYFFSPNGDGQNDIWIVKDLEKWPYTRVTLLNRWGMEVAHLGNGEFTWNGSNDSGHPLPDGVYYYVVEAGIKELDEEKIIHYSGYVTLTK